MAKVSLPPKTFQKRYKDEKNWYQVADYQVEFQLRNKGFDAKTLMKYMKENPMKTVFNGYAYFRWAEK